jgi:myosin heavy subunit
MVSMSVLNEPEILENLNARYNATKIFTHIGPTLIVVNPYKNVAKKVFARETFEKFRYLMQHRETQN